MRRNFRRIAAVSAVFVAGGLSGSAAFALGPDTKPLKPLVSVDSGYLLQLQHEAASAIKGNADHGPVGLPFSEAGPSPVDLPAPKPYVGIYPEYYANQAIQAVASALGNAAQGLGGVHVGPLPAPTPGVRPVTDRVAYTANVGIQTVADALGNAAQGLGGVHVGPLPAPTPGVIPLPG